MAAGPALSRHLFMQGRLRHLFLQGRLPLIAKQPHRQLSSSSIPASQTSEEAAAAVKFVVDRGYQQPVAEEVVKTLLDTGIPKSAILKTVTTMAGSYDIGVDAGLEALAGACEQELAKMEGRKLIRFLVQPPQETAEPFFCEGYEGMTITDVVNHGTGLNANLLGEHIECACSGTMACSTCQLIVHPEWFAKMDPPSEAEMDMIDLAYEPEETSRLGCAIVLTPELEGLKVQIPSGSNNLFDHIPFE